MGGYTRGKCCCGGGRCCNITTTNLVKEQWYGQYVGGGSVYEMTTYMGLDGVAFNGAITYGIAGGTIPGFSITFSPSDYGGDSQCCISSDPQQSLFVSIRVAMLSRIAGSTHPNTSGDPLIRGNQGWRWTGWTGGFTVSQESNCGLVTVTATETGIINPYDSTYNGALLYPVITIEGTCV